MTVAASARKLRSEEPARSDPSPGVDPDTIATLAHEVRNVLAPLGNACDLLLMLELEDENARAATHIIGRQVRKLKRLASDLLDSHCLAHEGIRLVLRRTNLHALVEAVCGDYQGLFASRGVALLPQWKPEPVWADVDPDRLDQVLNNLLSNSLKFTDRGGSVSLGLEVDAVRKLAVISVKDTGIGMSRQAIDTIFDLYAHELSYRNNSGLGLGMPLAKRLIDLHGGRLEVESAGPGCGTTVRVLISLNGEAPDRWVASV